MENEKIIHILLILCIISASLNIFQAHRERGLYNKYNEACVDLLKEHYCISAIDSLQYSIINTSENQRWLENEVHGKDINP